MAVAGAHKPLPVYDSAARRIPVLTTLADVFRYRYLVRRLVSRDLKVRYKRSVLGFGWVMVSPLLTMLVLSIVFAKVFGGSIQNYIAYVLVGVLLMNFFTQGTITAMSGVMGNAPLVRKMYVPPAVYVASTVGSALVNFAFALGPCLAISLIAGVRPHLTWLFIPVPMVETAMLTLGMGLLLACLMVFFNDTFEIYQVLISSYFFFTPIMYQISQLPPAVQPFERFNPMALFMEQFRDAFITGTLPPLTDSLIAAAIAIGVLIFGITIFSRFEQRFVYHV